MTENPANNGNTFSTASPDWQSIRLGSSGRSLPGCRTRIADPDPGTGHGEILSTGRNSFMGYLEDEEQTRRAVVELDGEMWVRTGDLGSIDQDGFVSIEGRIKDIIVTSGGKNIAPAPIEELLVQELGAVVSQAVVVGDRRPHLAVLLTLRPTTDPTTLEPRDRLEESAAAVVAKLLGAPPGPVTQLVADTPAPLWAWLQSGLEAVNCRVQHRAAHLHRFCVLPADLTIAGGELGPTLKVKRHVVVEKYAKQIEQMYESDTKV